VAEAPIDEAAARDVLLLEGDREIVRGLEEVLTAAGLHLTAVADAAVARDQITHRFFAVALLDLDTPSLLGGLELLAFVKQVSPLTATIILSPRRSFEAVASAFRAGATDVVPKTEAALPYLRDRVVRAVRELKAAADRDKLLGEATELHDAFLKEMMDLSRQVTDLEDKILRGDGEGSTTQIPTTVDVLIVDDQTDLPAALREALPADKGWRLRFAHNTGEALDAATQLMPQVLVAREDLPDLPASTLIKTLKPTAPDLVSLVFRSPQPAIDGGEARPGEVNLVESSKVVNLVPAYNDPAQLVTAIGDVREALRRKARERRYMSVFRKQHSGFMKRFLSLRHKLAKSMSGAKPPGWSRDLP
jgi:DNA-binding NtrC family response regulator